MLAAIVFAVLSALSNACSAVLQRLAVVDRTSEAKSLWRTAIDLVRQRKLRRSGNPVHRNAAVEGSAGEAGRAGNKIAEYVGEVFADIASKAPKVEIDVGTLRGIGDQPPPPKIRRQHIERRVREHAFALAR